MGQSKEFQLKLEINAVIQKLNTEHIMNKSEQDELLDHFHSEIENLKEIGLNDREAFEVCKLRFGSTELIEQEYEKERPQKSLVKKLIIGATFFFGVQLLMSAFRIINTAITVFVRQNLDIQVNAIFFYSTTSVISLSILGVLTYFLIKKVNWSTPYLFLLPVLSFLLYFGERVISVYVTTQISTQLFGNIMLNQSYAYVSAWFVLGCASVVLIFKNRNNLAFLKTV